MASPTVDDVRRLLALAGSREDYEHVFGQLKSAAWIPALSEAGIFNTPEPPIRQGDYILFPVWGPSRYLARVAGDDPERALEVLLRLPDTENWRVQADVIDAALALPVRLAVRLVPRVIAWLGQPSYGLIPEKAGELMKRLAEDGVVDQAIEIGRALLVLQGREAPRLSLDVEDAVRTEAVPRIDDYWYRHVLEDEFAAIVAIAPTSALSVLADALAAGLSIEHVSDDEPMPGRREDFSWIWRPAIEDHPQNQDFDILATLTAAVRDAAVHAVDSGAPVTEVVERLRAYGFVVYERLALHILAQRGAGDVAMVAEALTSRGLHESRSTWHEFAGLAQSWFHQLSPEDQRAYLQLIRESLDAADVDERAKGWATLRLWAVERHLPEDWTTTYTVLRAEVGLSDHPDFLFFSSGAAWVGPESPRSADEIAALSVDELIAYLREWEPPEGHFVPSMRGLARSVSSAVAAEPARFATASARFIELDRTYIDGMLAGFVEAVRAKKQFDWAPVLELCVWVAEQPTGESVDGDDADRELSWRGAQQTVVRLLEAGLEADPASIPQEAAQAAWAAVVPLTEHPDPTRESEERYGEPNMDWLTYSLNTVRTQALHAVCAYVEWLGRGVDGRGLPMDVAGLLERHLDIDAEPSVAARAVYGWWLPTLATRDPDWVAGAIDRILPLDPERDAYRRSAWNAYLMRWWPGEDLFRLLAPYYQAAVERLPQSKGNESSRGDRQGRERLAHHIAVVFYRDWTDEDGLLGSFLALASDEDRADLVEFLGRILQDAEQVPEETLARLMGFWEGRLADATPSESRRRELAAFGWWFASPHLDRRWAIGALLRVVEETRHVDASWRVLEALEEAAGVDAAHVLEILKRLLTGPDPDQMIRHDEHIQEVLRQVLRSGDDETKSRTTDLIHELGRRGYRDLGELLRQPSASESTGTASA